MTFTRMVNGEAIKQLRKKDGVSAVRFAGDVGISPSYLSHIEKGRKQPSLTVLRAMAYRLAVPVESFTHVIEIAGDGVQPMDDDDDDAFRARAS